MRYGVVAFGVALAADLHLNGAGMGLVFGACATACAFCEIPGGEGLSDSGALRIFW
jgi:hypothetical protein